MSWQDYVDKQLVASGCVTKAFIAGLDGNMWAQSPGFQVDKDEVLKLIAGLANVEAFQTAGIFLAGERYIYLSGTDRIIRARKGTTGVHCVKTTQAMVIALYDHPTQPQQAATVVEKLGDYLVSCGY